MEFTAYFALKGGKNRVEKGGGGLVIAEREKDGKHLSKVSNALHHISLSTETGGFAYPRLHSNGRPWISYPFVFTSQVLGLQAVLSRLGYTVLSMKRKV